MMRASPIETGKRSPGFAAANIFEQVRFVITLSIALNLLFSSETLLPLLQTLQESIGKPLNKEELLTLPG